MEHHVELIAVNIRHKLSVPQRSSIAVEKKNPSTLHKVPFFALPRQVAPFFSGFFVLCAALRLGRRTDVIVAQYHPHTLLAPFAVLLGSVLKIPVIFRADDVYREMGSSPNLAEKIMNLVDEHFIKYSKAFLVVCSEQRRILLSRQRQGGFERQVFLSVNGVDLSEFNIPESKREIRKRLGFGNDEKIVLFVGRYSGEVYGIEILIRALAIILEKIPNLALVLVGDKPTPGQMLLINSLQAANRIRLYGPMSHAEVVRFIISADVCIGPLNPTLTIPLKVAEYMACGKPVVTGLNSVSQDIAVNGYNCICVPPESKAVAEAIASLLQNRKYAKMLSLNAMKTGKCFTWDEAADDLNRMLHQLIKEVPGTI